MCGFDSQVADNLYVDVAIACYYSQAQANVAVWRVSANPAVHSHFVFDGHDLGVYQSEAP